MSNRNSIVRKLFTALGAVAMTATLMVSSFAVPTPTPTAFTGILA